VGAREDIVTGFLSGGRAMTSKSQKHSIVGFLQLSGKKSAWGVLFGLALLGVFLAASAQAATFTVNSPADPPTGDANPGNGVCETAAGNGVCTLRAAIQEANALAGADQIILPPNTYLLTPYQPAEHH
jgi:CSLREA domain-containing protein